MNPVNELFRACEKAAHLNYQDLSRVATVIDQIDMSCLGESEFTFPTQFCEFVEIANEPSFQIALFKVPAGHQIPLHDHPGMTVLSKVIYGSVQVHSYDTGGNRVPHIGRTLETELLKNGEIWTEASGVQATLPGKGNLHEMRALAPACILDVLTPPYGDFGTERDCSYFEVVRRHERACTLRRIECPKSFWTVSSPYCGLPVHEDHAPFHTRHSTDPSLMRAPSDDAALVPTFEYYDGHTCPIQGPDSAKAIDKRGTESLLCSTAFQVAIDSSARSYSPNLWAEQQVANH